MKMDTDRRRSRASASGVSVAIVVPAYRERDNILPLVERIDLALRGTAYHVLIVDDNSRDGTEELVDKIRETYPVELMVRKDRRGLASAVVDGLARVRNEVAVVMDADLQHPPELLARMLAEIAAGADLVVASRYIPGGSSGEFSLVRRMISSAATLLAHLLLFPARRVRDPMSGFFALRTRGLENARLDPAGYKILLEIICMGDFATVAEVPFSFQMRSAGESKLNARQQLEYLKHLLSLMRRTGEITRIWKFGLVGVSGILVNEGLLYLLRGVALLPLWLASALSIESSIISNFSLNEAFTFRDRRVPGAASLFRRLFKFNLISLGGLLINLGVLTLLVNVFHLYYLLANLIGILIAFSWNFVLNSLWTWREKTPVATESADKKNALA